MNTIYINLLTSFLDPKVGYVFEYINSWGKQNKEEDEDEDEDEVIPNCQMADLYYISLYSSPNLRAEEAIVSQSSDEDNDKSFVILSSQGNAGEESGVVPLLGLYQEKGIHLEVILFCFV